MDFWTPTEHAGDATPYGLQHPLSRAEWDAAVSRDDLRGFDVGQLHDEEAVEDLLDPVQLRLAVRVWSLL
ncbi:hypothetical protein [Streptomyces mirabilis]